jgi:hypothetical protein
VYAWFGFVGFRWSVGWSNGRPSVRSTLSVTEWFFDDGEKENQEKHQDSRCRGKDSKLATSQIQSVTTWVNSLIL